MKRESEREVNYMGPVGQKMQRTNVGKGRQQI